MISSDNLWPLEFCWIFISINHRSVQSYFQRVMDKVLYNMTKCYIMTVDKDFGFVLVTPYALKAVTLWLVNLGLVMRRGRPVEQVCNRNETKWYENHAVRFRQSVQSESRVEPGTSNWSEASLTSLTIRLARWVQTSAPPGSRKKIWGKKNSPFWVYVSPSISQTYNKLCAPFENKMKEICFYKEVCFVSLIEVRSLPSRLGL